MREIGWTDDGELTPVTDGEAELIAAIDKVDPETTEWDEKLEAVGLCFRQVFLWIFEPKSTNAKLTRLFAACYVLDVQPGKTMQEQGRCIGVTRAAISATAIRFNENFGHRCGKMRSLAARENNRKARYRVLRHGPEARLGCPHAGERKSVATEIRNFKKHNKLQWQHLAEIFSERKDTVRTWCKPNTRHLPPLSKVEALRRAMQEHVKGSGSAP